MSEDIKLDEQKLNAEQKAQLKKVMAKESKKGRRLTGFWGIAFSVLGCLMVLIYFYGAGIRPAPTQYNRGIYVLLTYVMIFLAFPFSKKSSSTRPGVLDLALALASMVVVGYYMLEFENFNYRAGAANQMDVWISIIGVLISLEVCRRVLGWSMTLAGIFFIIYGLYGRYFPGMFGHRGFGVERLAVTLFMEQDGVFGIMANVLVTYVILFIFFGAFLQKSGVGRFFIDWPMALAGKSVGGPAKVSVIASAFFGSVSGSAIANTVSTGAFTIPLMKRAGFRPHVAGAIEPAASIGGMFMPPIMGAGGFLMAELTNLPYVQIMKMAVFPAILYFLSVLTMIHFEAKKHNITGLEDQDVKASEIFKKHWYKSLPLVIIVVMMLVGYSPGMSAFWATISCVVISWFDREFRMGPREIWEAVVQGARSTLVIGATVGTIGVIVGTIALSGIGLKFSDIIFSLSENVSIFMSTISFGLFGEHFFRIPAAILLIGIASLVLGMGVPVTASYLITAVLAVPAISELLLQAGIHGHTAASVAIASHMIVYWFSQDSNITPPVCVAAYAGAAIAGSDPWKTGWTSFKFAKLLYVVPFLFAYEPAILLYGSWGDIALAFFTATVGTIAFSALTMGYLIRRTTVLEWLIFAVGTFLCYNPKLSTDLIGIFIIFLVYLMQKYKNKKEMVASVI